MALNVKHHFGRLNVRRQKSPHRRRGASENSFARTKGNLYSVRILITRDFSERLRWVSSRIFLRSRRFFGVASTYSSEPMYSSARSSESLNGGESWMPLPSPCERM